MDNSISIGVDIVSIHRITKEINKKTDGFIKRVYTRDEIIYCKGKENMYQHFTGKFAGKEAVCKALRITWDEGLFWKDIEIVNKKNGIPYVLLHGKVKKIANEKKVEDIQISISHEKDYAIAFALIVEGYKK